MTNELAPINVDDFDRQLAVAGKLIKTGFLPKAIDTPEKAVAIAMTGRELGIGMMLALQEINVIQGKPAASAKLQLALARKTRELDNFSIEDDGQTSTCVVQRKGQAPVTTTFSNADAKAMGLMGKDNWNKQPGNMRRWRAVSANLRLTFPDAIGGLYTPEELSPETIVDADGRVADELHALPQVIRAEIAKPRAKAATPPHAAPEPPKPVQTPLPASKPASEAPAKPDQASEAFIVMGVEKKTKAGKDKEGKPETKVWYVVKAVSDFREIEATTYSESFADLASQSTKDGFKVAIELKEKPSSDGKKVFLNIVNIEPVVEEATPTE